MKTDEMFVYLGTYTSGEGEGIYLCRLDIEDGSLSTPELVAEMDNPTFLAIHPNERYLYAVSEVRKHGERKGGAVSAFQRDAVSGSISILNSQPSGGSGPCHLNIDAAGGGVSLWPIMVAGACQRFRWLKMADWGRRVPFSSTKGAVLIPNGRRGHTHIPRTCHPITASSLSVIWASIGLWSTV